jgi:hypothetical protein
VIDPMSLACRATGMDLMVRVLKTGYSTPMRCLEFGAMADGSTFAAWKSSAVGGMVPLSSDRTARLRRCRR